MKTKSVRGIPCFLFVVSALATAPAFASADPGAGMGGTRIVSGTEDFVGPGGATVSGGALGATRIVSGTEDFVGPGGAAVGGGARGVTLSSL